MLLIDMFNCQQSEEELVESSCNNLLCLVSKHLHVDKIFYILQYFQVHLHVINKVSGEVSNTEYHCQPFFFFHTINAFEKSRLHSSSSSSTKCNQADVDADSITIDLLAYKDSEVC